jgi:chromate reductase
MKILAVCGSLQAKSANRTLLNTAATLTPSGVELVFFDGLGDLPHFNPDLEASRVPGSVTRWRQALSTSHAVLIASPEYGFVGGTPIVIGPGLESQVAALLQTLRAATAWRQHSVGRI